ncbi:MAG: hypothetical protein ABIN58_10480, partial [candidate division WOR-3 bacterium]
MFRNAQADQHTYVEQRPAAWFDWQVANGQQTGVAFQYVVQDKNDWVPNHLNGAGVFHENGAGYYAADNTRVRWLQRQWWRYCAARWGYSTAVRAWELCNEGPPADPGSPHALTAQSFARYMHTIDAHPHLASTSFWAGWRPAFWGDNANYGDVSYADRHAYTEGDTLGYDLASWYEFLANGMYPDAVGKPIIIAETGVSTNFGPITELAQANDGTWYHNLLWAQLSHTGVSCPNYWFSEHFQVIQKDTIAARFARFVRGLDLNRGGYVPLGATVSNPQLRVAGQKNFPLVVVPVPAHHHIPGGHHVIQRVGDSFFFCQQLVGFPLGNRFPAHQGVFSCKGAERVIPLRIPFFGQVDSVLLFRMYPERNLPFPAASFLCSGLAAILVEDGRSFIDNCSLSVAFHHILFPLPGGDGNGFCTARIHHLLLSGGGGKHNLPVQPQGDRNNAAVGGYCHITNVSVRITDPVADIGLRKMHAQGIALPVHGMDLPFGQLVEFIDVNILKGHFQFDVAHPGNGHYTPSAEVAATAFHLQHPHLKTGGRDNISFPEYRQRVEVINLYVAEFFPAAKLPPGGTGRYRGTVRRFLSGTECCQAKL